jgi:hypothetical protein
MISTNAAAATALASAALTGTETTNTNHLRTGFQLVVVTINPLWSCVVIIGSA